MIKRVSLLLLLSVVGATSSFQLHHAVNLPTKNLIRSSGNVQSPHFQRGLQTRGQLSAAMPALPALRSALSLKGGFTFASTFGTGPDGMFNALFAGLLATVFSLKTIGAKGLATKDDAAPKEIDPKVKSLQWRFLAVFWLFRLAEWLQGPYFYEVYASKVINGIVVTQDMIGYLFLSGFLTTALLGPVCGKLVDGFGRKKGSLAFVLFYVLGALSTKSPLLWLLFVGRFASGIGTALLFCAPEAWLATEHERKGLDGASLGKIFGLAYFGDSLVAMLAGQLAQASASVSGPTGPFMLSIAFLIAGGIMATALWGENTAGNVASTSAAGDEKGSSSSGGLKPAWEAMKADKKIISVGLIQSLFEGAMYTFVLQWPPAMIAAMSGGAKVPFGRIFSCLMASCMVGSTIFSKLINRGIAVERSISWIVGMASIALACAAGFGLSNLPLLIASFFAFEAAVGFYFPAMGTLRARYLPDEYRGIMMTMFGVPLNLMVVAVYTNIRRLGTKGALLISATALAGSCLASLRLQALIKEPSDEKA
uniref:Molybdate-anion transporter n=1 Tax=Octactis speculum TaxID=3111310 RepID=A0A7S2GU32_9STRA|mmetsp:Transcript_57621/g.78566  ORF Transcript_57621/g.78566 Transcript_57621/m.78566 type:complete len:537 (+) Transcript_57621:38-1648(+)